MQMTFKLFIILLLSSITDSYIKNVYNIIPKRSLVTILRYKKNIVKNRELQFINDVIENSYVNTSIPIINNKQLKKTIKNTVIYDNNIKNISSI